jgi:uncharacterized membrane protein (UPF0127 family)
MTPWLLLGMCAALAGCARDDAAEETAAEPVIHFDSAEVAITTATNTIRVPVEIADTDDERGYGLMDRTKLADNAGMLFVYDAMQDSSAGFYMYRTQIPLDIAFTDSAGVIVSIKSMEPCTLVTPTHCTIYQPGARYQNALEVNRGFFARHGITPGAKIVRVEKQASDR